MDGRKVRGVGEGGEEGVEEDWLGMSSLGGEMGCELLKSITVRRSLYLLQRRYRHHLCFRPPIGIVAAIAAGAEWGDEGVVKGGYG